MKIGFRLLLISLFLFFLANSYGQQILWWHIVQGDKDYDPKHYVDCLAGKSYMFEKERCIEACKSKMPGIFYDTLKLYSHDFLLSLDYKKRYTPTIAWFMGLLNLPDSIKQYMLYDTITPLYVKARLGDKQAEKMVLAEYKRRITNRKDSIFLDWADKDIMWEVLYINTPNATKTFVKGFKTKAFYYDSYYHYHSSLLKNLFLWYSSFYKSEVIKNILESPGYMVLLYTNDIRKESDIELCFKKLNKEIKKKHNVRVKIKAHYLIKASEYKYYMTY